jgi:UDP-N-acetylmuramate dehydrogenase
METLTPPSGFDSQVSLAQFTTLRIGGTCDWLTRVSTAAEVKQACDWAADHHIPVVVLGEGSNMVVGQGPLHRLVIKIELPGFELDEADTNQVTVRVGGGEHWDDVVRRTVEAGLAGLEAMSMIPGTAGAAPVQNAGAYGQETADHLVSLEAYDTQERRFVTLRREECGFSYRSSRFREADAGRFVITSVTFQLHRGKPQPPTYDSLKRYLAEHEITNPTLPEIRQAVMAIRARILPDPSVVPNAGSFFKNPIVRAEKVDELQADHDHVPVYPYGEGAFKVSAGWLLDQCGFKGVEKFGLKIWDHHALVITNPHGADYAALMKLVTHMQATVKRRFGIELEPEPLFIR